MEIDNNLAIQGTEGLVALLLLIQKQALEIQFLMQTFGAHLNNSDPQAGYQMVQEDCAKYVEAHSQHLTKFHEYLKTLEQARESLTK